MGRNGLVMSKNVPSSLIQGSFPAPVVNGNSVLIFFRNSGRFSLEFPKVKELRPPDFSPPHHIYSLDER
jgi:hypothetical protein